jgi:hypothetical protein
MWKVVTIYCFLFLFVVVLLGVHCGIYKSSYTITTISYLNSLPLSLFFTLPPRIPGIVSAGLSFPFTYVYTQYWCHFYPPTSFPHILPPWTGTNPPDQTSSALLFSNSVKGKKMTFLFVWDSDSGRCPMTFPCVSVL